MSEPSVREVVVSCLATACDAERAAIMPSTELRAIGLDSLSLVTVAALVEAAGGITLDEATAARLLEARTVADLVDVFEDAVRRG